MNDLWTFRGVAFRRVLCGDTDPQWFVRSVMRQVERVRSCDIVRTGRPLTHDTSTPLTVTRARQRLRLGVRMVVKVMLIPPLSSAATDRRRWQCGPRQWQSTRRLVRCR